MDHAEESATLQLRGDVPELAGTGIKVADLRGAVEHHSIVCDFQGEPLLDAQTAHVMVLVYDAFQKESSRERFERKLDSYQELQYLANFCWAQVTPRG